MHPPQPLHQSGPGHQHGGLHVQLVSGHFGKQGRDVLARKELPQELRHEIRVTGLLIGETAAGGLALLPLHPVAQILHLFPTDHPAQGGQLFRNEAGRRRFDQIRVMGPANEQGVEKVEGNGRAGPGGLLGCDQQFPYAVTGFPAHGLFSRQSA